MNNNLIKLINIAKRIHHTEASRADILKDLATISEKELEALESYLKKIDECAKHALKSTKETVEQIDKHGGYSGTKQCLIEVDIPYYESIINLK